MDNPLIDHPESNKAEGCGGQFHSDTSLIGQNQRSTTTDQEQPARKPNHAKRLLGSIQKQWKKEPIAVILALLAASQAYYSNRQWHAAQDAMMTAERAWVYPLDFVATDPKDGTMTVTIRIANSGQSPGLDVQTQTWFSL